LPPVQATGNIFRKGKVWQLDDAYAQVGESDLAGRLSVDLSRPRPFVSADLESDRLRARDLITTQRERQAAAGEGARERC
jgi:AsmA family protein